jgi:EAL domain-containing protein (putative c-di-GMP-specific phosphodiesterase class I)
MDFFRERLVAIASRLQVNFAVDDFGVDHASLERISKLALTQIKVDRDILHHPRGLDELRLVVEIAQDTLQHGSGPAAREVVVEGFDGLSEVTLKDIYDLGIMYVQGHIAQQPAATQLKALDKNVRRTIAALVRGEHEHG